MSEQAPTTQEAREAAALARALEGDEAQEAGLEGALEMAALLRRAASSVNAGLTPERAEAIKARVLGSEALAFHARQPPKPPRAWPWRLEVTWWGWGLSGAAAALSLGLILWPTGDEGPWSATPPGVELLKAQAWAASGAPEGLSALRREMAQDRRARLAQLSARYAP
ncbi:hypothetical protein KKF91_04080 [Myxococcota bacterium]|nr:hypothetical protein [Myxococcota bacterium]MBU1429723.1 hypothetical protein [Myxococcota bacterium]MBU1898326.1 hypothetical protein [Myxococcota bacterium]